MVNSAFSGSCATIPFIIGKTVSKSPERTVTCAPCTVSNCASKADQPTQGGGEFCHYINTKCKKNACIL